VARAGSLIAVVVMFIQGAVSSDMASASAPAASPPPLSASPNPLAVTLLPDASRAVSKMIRASQGGTISATAGNGTTTSVTLPPYALSADTQITVTPINGLLHPSPFADGVVGGALLQPSGLTFWLPVALTIEPRFPVTVPNNRVPVAFTSGDDGTEFHLYPWTGDASSMKLALWHFSSYGIGLASPADVANLAQHTPSPLTPLYQQLQAAVAANQWIQDHGVKPVYTTAELMHQLKRIATWKFNAVIKPHLLVALVDAYDGVRALQDALAWQSDMVTGAAKGYFKSRLTKLLPLISREAKHLLQGLAKPCSTSSRSLYYYPGQGWTIDARDFSNAYGTYQAFVGRGLIAASTTYLTKLVAPCRPRGFKFSASYRLYSAGIAPSSATSSFPGSWLDETVSGQICGSDPYDDVGAPFSNAWTISSAITEVGYSAGSSPPLTLPPTPSVTKVAMVQGAWDRAGQHPSGASWVRYRTEAGPPASMKVEVVSGTFSPDDQIVEVPLSEDGSCPVSGS